MKAQGGVSVQAKVRADADTVLEAYRLQDAWLAAGDDDRSVDGLRRVREAEELANRAMARLTARLGASGARDAISARMREVKRHA
jgi:hypothetical protein